MDESILIDVKKLAGLAPEDDSFDKDLIIYINTVIAVLTQLGVTPSQSFILEDQDTQWSDYLPSDTSLETFQFVRSYISMKVRLIFDPPQNTTVMDALKGAIAECEWRINVEADVYPEDTSINDED